MLAQAASIVDRGPVEASSGSTSKEPEAGAEAVAADMECGFGGTFTRNSDRGVGDAATAEDPKGDRLGPGHVEIGGDELLPMIFGFN